MSSHMFPKIEKTCEVNHEKSRVKVKIDDSDINRLIHVLSGYDIHYISEVKQTLEDYFMHFYDNKTMPDGITYSWEEKK